MRCRFSAALFKSSLLLTGLAGDDHWLHDERKEFIQHQVEEEDQRL